ncbi:MAG: hypothetical protein QOJ40_1322 [Verrucomicrobiota bacterium]
MAMLIIHKGQPVISLEGERLLQVEVPFIELGEKEITLRTFEQLVRIQATQNPDEVKDKAEIIPWVAMPRAGTPCPWPPASGSSPKCGDARDTLDPDRFWEVRLLFVVLLLLPI